MSTALAERVQSEVTELGARLRELRNRRGWTLDALAKRAGLSKSYLSRLEDGERQPTIAALLSLAQAFDLTLAALFEPETDAGLCAIVRAGESPQREGNGLCYTSLSVGGPSSGMHPMLVCVPAGRVGDEQYRHEGQEWLYVLSGTLRLSLAEDTHDLAPGDAAHFDARVPHRLSALGGEDVRLILVACTPPKELPGSDLLAP